MSPFHRWALGGVLSVVLLAGGMTAAANTAGSRPRAAREAAPHTD